MAGVRAIDTPGLGNRSYIVADGRVGAAIDPPRDADRVLAEAARMGVRLTAVLETHLHNDWISGGPALAQRAGAGYVLPAGEDVVPPHRQLRDGEPVRVGELELRAISTPGHTPHHLSYALVAGGTIEAIFTGGSLLHGTVGRPDLLGPELALPLARSQWRSSRRLAREVPPAARVLPTHGFGSFCSVGTPGTAASTMSEELETNPVFGVPEDEFVHATLGALDPFPAYYARMGPANRAGAIREPAAPTAIDLAGVRRRVRAGEWVVDVRPRSSFASGHLPGTVNVGSDGKLATFLAWLKPEGARLTVLASSAAQLAHALDELARVGVCPDAAMVGVPADALTARYRRGAFADIGDRPVLDVRLGGERASEGALEHAIWIPLHELGDRMDELPDQALWVHCGTGYRSSIAVSLLRRAGFDALLVDEAFAGRGLPGAAGLSAAR